MTSEERKLEILNILNSSDKPISGSQLAKKLEVSRQVIVQDIAILRAKGKDIIATPQGYIILKDISKNKIIKTIACKHLTYAQIEDELKTIVDLGGKVLDVIVEHPVYGEIKSSLMISSRLDVDKFLKDLKDTNAEPLSSLTEGFHIHTIEVEKEEVFIKIKKVLRDKKYLINE